MLKDITKRKKIIISLSLTLLAWMLLFIVIQYYSGRDKKDVDTTSVAITEPDITSITSIEDLNIIITISEEDFQFPSEVSVIIEGESPSFTEDQALKIAKNYGFSDNYKKFVDVKVGDTYIWSENSKSLIIYLDAGIISYVNKKTGAINKQLTDNQLSTIAKEFINMGDFYKEDIDVFNILTANEAQNIKRVNLTPKISDIPIISGIPNGSAIYTDIPQDGEVMNAYMRNMNNLLLSKEKHATKNLEEIRSTIKESSVISLGDHLGEYLPPISMGDINNIVITDIKLAYLIPEGTEKIYYPIYVLSGTASLIPSTKPEPITLYLSALK